jgi:hypothetical protein
MHFFVMDSCIPLNTHKRRRASATARIADLSRAVLAAGVLALPRCNSGAAEAENLAPPIFAAILLSVLVFAIGFSIVARLPDEPATIE